MTDKQIIIDGVDVSGCNCFIEKMNFFMRSYQGAFPVFKTASKQ